MNKAVAEQFQIFCGKEIKPDDWLWCKRCHRCYQASEFRKSKDKGQIFLLCHYGDCNGDLPLDSIPWNKLIGDLPGLPRLPARGKSYECRVRPVRHTSIERFEDAPVGKDMERLSPNEV